MNSISDSQRCIAFEGQRRIASGDLAEVVRKTKQVLDRGERAPVLILDEISSQPVEIDFRGKVEEILVRLRRPPPAPVDATRRGPGRPKLGVVSREVTLLPRHWEWLNEQPGGASVALRKLVEEARRLNAGKDLARRAQESLHRFMTALAGNLPQYEEALRAFYAKDKQRFSALIANWPKDVRDHAERLAAACQ